MRVAEARLAKAKAESMPTIVGLATGGYFDNQDLRDKWNYSAGLGISWQFFTGFRVESGIAREAAELSSQKAGFEHSMQQIDRYNSQFDEQIRAMHVRLSLLVEEAKLAQRVYKLARDRYLDMQGNILDLRESLKNMSRVMQSKDEAHRDLYLAQGRARF